MWEGAVSLWEAREQFIAHLDGDEGLRLVRYLLLGIVYLCVVHGCMISRCTTLLQVLHDML